MVERLLGPTLLAIVVDIFLTVLSARAGAGILDAERSAPLIFRVIVTGLGPRMLYRAAAIDPASDHADAIDQRRPIRARRLPAPWLQTPTAKSHL